MARRIIDIGTIGNDGTGDSIRDSFRKVNDNFRELYSSLGLGERLEFINLDDTPETYVGNEAAVLSVNATTDGVIFKQIVGETGINVDTDTNPNEIRISPAFTDIAGDKSPQLGGNLSAQSGGDQWKIVDLAIPTEDSEAANKEYADTKLSRFGTNSVDPATGQRDSQFGTMSGPLILSRDPEPEDDEVYGGLIAATKRYVDNSSFGSSVNLYVATSGSDERPGVAGDLQGRALAYAYKTIEAACKRAEELILESQKTIGPYRKVLTYNNGNNICTLNNIDTSPVSGTGFVGTVTMSVETVEIENPGVNFLPGDIFEIDGGIGTPARFEVLQTSTTPGPIVTFRQLSSGVYTTLPGSDNVATITDSSNGRGLTLNVRYKVNNIQIVNGGSDYSLVSVRISLESGASIRPAFGTAIVEDGVITNITITDPGSGFTAIPTIEADLPRFSITTQGYRTDFTGDVETDTAEAYRGRDIREGLYLQGVESGALAQILAHSGELDSEGREIFDVDVLYGIFETGEPIAYGDVAKIDQITILVESGNYYENYPIKVPANVSIVGNEFRRVIIRPRQGTSSSPWAFQKFRRDKVIDSLDIADNEYGYHYLHDPSQPVYPKIDNGGNFFNTSELLKLNKFFIAKEVIGWINEQIRDNIAPFSDEFEYNETLCERDVGLIIDAIVYDITYGGYNRTVSAALKYFESASSRIAITTQLAETTAGINRIFTLVQSVITNTEVADPYGAEYLQIIDNAFTAEVGSETVIQTLINVVTDIISESGTVNYPKENEDMDVFLCNDSVRLQAISCIGHGGFMMTLDPEGQILSRSPYAQECASFSRSKDRPVFAGGMFVDGFAGNLEFRIIGKNSNTSIRVDQLDRLPNLPCSFIENDTVYRVNYIRDFIYNKDGSSATLVLDETTPWTFPVFTYNDAACSRDAGLILEGLGYELVLGTNYHGRKAGLTYRQANAGKVVEEQLNISIEAIEYQHDLVKDIISGFDSTIDSSESTITRILQRGATYAPDLILPAPSGVNSNIENAVNNLAVNIDFIQDEILGWTDQQITLGAAPFNVSYEYDKAKCSRDTQYIIESLMYDLMYGGNSQTVDSGLKYYDGILNAVVSQTPGDESINESAVQYMKYLAKQVIVNAPPAVSYGNVPQDTSTTASNAATQAIIETLLGDTATIIGTGVGAAPTIVYPDLDAYTYNATAKTARTTLLSEKTTVQTAVIDYVDINGNKHELLMPGNRSMLANDFTQINDLGYGVAATNGGLSEVVSMFTYYCHISYYSLNGAQIRSVGGSSAHGNYALVAEGADPLEVPTPTDLYHPLSQRVDCYFPSPSYANAVEGLYVYVTNYDYTPLNNSELEVDHGNLIYRYPVTSVTTTDLPDGVARLNLTSDDTGNFDG